MEILIFALLGRASTADIQHTTDGIDLYEWTPQKNEPADEIIHADTKTRPSEKTGLFSCFGWSCSKDDGIDTYTTPSHPFRRCKFLRMARSLPSHISEATYAKLDKKWRPETKAKIMKHLHTDSLAINRVLQRIMNVFQKYISKYGREWVLEELITPCDLGFFYIPFLQSNKYKGFAALEVAVLLDNVAFVKAAIEVGFNRFHDVVALTKLVSHYRAPKVSKLLDYSQQIHMAVLSSGHQEVPFPPIDLSKPYEYSINIQYEAETDRNVFHIAVEHDLYYLVHPLIAAGADPTRPHPDLKKTPLEISIEHIEKYEREGDLFKLGNAAATAEILSSVYQERGIAVRKQYEQVILRAKELVENRIIGMP